MNLAVARINNPLLNVTEINGTVFFSNTISAVVTLLFIAGVVIFVFILIISAIKWITSGGDKAKTAEARQGMFNAIIGLIILFSVYAILQIMGALFGIDFIGVDTSGVSGGPGCFLAGTDVKMHDGSYKSIEEVKEGDLVYSYNLKAGDLVESRVDEVFVHESNPGGYLIINDELNVTGNHIMWNSGESQWQRADQLSVGDTLLGSGGQEIKIKTIDKVEGEYTVYNLHLDGDDHNYFAEDVLVHNVKDPGF